jgi:hypothetical protein
MPWSVSFLADVDAVLTVYSGVVPGESLQAAVEATLALARRHRCWRFLGDLSSLEGGHSVVDLYDLARMAEAARLDGGFREAIVLPALPAATTEARFWETACRNRGLDVRVFPTVAEAKRWLGGGGQGHEQDPPIGG